MSPSLPRSGPSVRSDGSFSRELPGALQALVQRYGVTLLEQGPRLRGLLLDELPSAKREVSVLLLALEEHIPQDLLRVHAGESSSSLRPRLARRLVEEKALAPPAAYWAVDAWAWGLGVALDESPSGGVDAVFDGPDGPQVAALAAPASAADDAPERFSGGIPGTEGGQPGSGQGRFGGTADAHSVRPGGAAAVMSRPWAAVALLAVALLAAWWWTRSGLSVARVDAVGAVYGDGKPVAVQLEVGGRDVAVSRVEIRLVEGEGDWVNREWSLDIPPEDRRLRRLPAGSLQIHSTEASTVTLEYVLVAEDGARSAPFSRRFEVLPAAQARAPGRAGGAGGAGR